jgi:pyruvate/2-oxoglutarate dehydrogenase complex dihydrolipoamide acyltransferase (E2) component
MSNPQPMQVKIPSLGVSMTDGTLESWEVADGEQVSVGDILYVVTTDKVEQEIESPASGTIRLIGVEGQTYDVGTVIAEIS